MIREGDIVAGGDFAVGLHAEGITYDGYIRGGYSFNPGGGPMAMSVEIIAEFGARVSWEFYSNSYVKTSLSLDFGYLMDFAKQTTLADPNTYYLCYNGLVIRPCLWTSMHMFWDYSISIGVFYQAVTYPRPVGKELDGLGFAVKFF